VSKIRVLHCIETIASGGVEQVRLTLIRGLDKHKYEHKIICTWEGGAVAAALKAEGVELIPIGSFKHPFEWKKHKQVLKVIKAYRPHIIHGAIFEGMSMAAISGKLGRVPVIILEETSHPVSRSRKAIYLLRLFALAADKVIGIAPAVVNYLVERAGMPKKKVCLINNGVNEPREVSYAEIEKLKADLGIQVSDFVIGSAGRLYNDVKRFSDILEAIQLLNNPSVKFLLLGQGRDMELLQTEAKALGLENQFIPVGYQKVTAPYYKLMDIFCLASAHEGFGLVAAEAMLHSLPVIATKVGGLADVVVDGETGFLVPPFSPESLAQKIQELIDKPEHSKQMGEAGYQRAMEKFTATRYCQEVEDLYTLLLKQKRVVIS
jgi:glycosyltransferase involved in cell wall biosynthesis